MIAVLKTDRPERTEEGETEVGPLPKTGDKSAKLIVKSPGRKGPTSHATRQPKEEEAGCQGKCRR